MVSGGSAISLSWMFAAITVTVQTTPTGRLPLGVSVKLLAGEALATNAIGVPAGHSSLKAVPVALTGSLKLIVIGVSIATGLAPATGRVLLTLGAASVVKVKTSSATILSGGSAL